MAAAVSLLVVLFLALLATRVGAVALTLTGLSHEAARFQARSSFLGVGFTTAEAENVVNHPVRRRIVMLLMLLGNAGFVTVISTSILAFLSLQDAPALQVLLLLGGAISLWLLTRSRFVERNLSRWISWALARYTSLDVRDYSGLLRVSGDFSVVELQVEPEDWLAGRTLVELRLRDEGVLVLGVVRADGSYVGAPRGHTLVQARDTMILYGRDGACEGLDRRRRGAEGEEEHRAAVAATAERRRREAMKELG